MGRRLGWDAVAVNRKEERKKGKCRMGKNNAILSGNNLIKT